MNIERMYNNYYYKLILEKREKIANLSKEYSLHISSIKSKLYNFTRKEEQAKELEKLTLHIFF